MDATQEGSINEHSTNDTERSALRAQLVQLITQQGMIFTNWVKFAITVQGGLAAGLGFVLGTSALAEYRLLGVMIAIFGIAAAVVFARILVRHTQWTEWYVRRCNELDGTRKILPQPGEIPEVKWKELALPWRLRPVIRWVVAFLWLVAVAWIVILGWLLFCK
jgi:hypothetical protein